MRTSLMIGLAGICAPVLGAMPASEQNALVMKYCAVCHTDQARNGGLSLQHYDAARRDPPLAAMILSKLNNGAMGAAGNGVPDKPAQQAWLLSTKEQAVGATHWFVSRESGVTSASIVRPAPARTAGPAELPVYRVRIACNASTGKGEMELTWSPQPQTGRSITVSVDGNSSLAYELEGRESMGNGSAVQSGLASVFLGSAKGRKMPFPNVSLTVRDLFPGEAVTFPFSQLDQKAREDLRRCF